MMGNKNHPKIIVVGSVNYDVFMRTERLPMRGETITADKIWSNYGGKGANQAVAAARLGARSIMVCKVGEDDVGTKLIKNFENAGVDTKHIWVEKGESSGMAYVTVEKSGENVVVIYSGANKKMNTSDLTAIQDEMKDCDAIVAQLEIPVPTVALLSEIARKSNVPFILNPAPALSEDISYFLKNVDVICPNRTEAEEITGIKVNTKEDAKSAAIKLLESGVKNVVVTLGKYGVLLKNREVEIYYPAHEVEVCDTTGAGDSFVGAFSYFLGSGMDIAEAVKWANCASSISVTREGTQTALPTLDEVKAFLKRIDL